MSNAERIENLKLIVARTKPEFEKLAKFHGAVHFEREASFAHQILLGSQYLQGVALENKDSFIMAILNVAGIGLSLNPVLRLAYLVPRDKKIHLDVSFPGYVQLAVAAGAIRWAKAEIVREKDKFRLRGTDKEPLHEFDPFKKERGKIVGAYCVAKTPEGDFLTDWMSIEDIYGIRDRSAAWKAYVKDKSKTCPWVTDEGEMIKKTVGKRAYKSWPKTNSPHSARLEKAIEVSNETDAVELGAPPASEIEKPEYQEGIAKIRASLQQLDKTEPALLGHIQRTNKRDLHKIEDMTLIEIGQTNAFLDQLIEAKLKRAEAERENFA